MVLDIQGGLFAGRGITVEEARAATIIVAQDGSGDTDDIQEGINMLPPGAGVVFIKEGTYTLASSIVIYADSTALIGVGKSTKIQTTVNTALINLNSKSNILIKSLYLYGAGTGNTSNYGINATASDYCIITECWIENCGGYIILFDGSTFNIVSNCHINSNFHISILLWDASNDNIISGNQLDSNETGVYIHTSLRNQILGNSITNGTGHGIASWNGSHYTIIVNNICLSNVADGILLEDCSNCIIKGNICKDNDVNNSQAYNGISIEDDSNNNIIASNRCEDNDANEIGIMDAACDKNLIHGNICIGSDHEGDIHDGGTNTVSADNIVA